MSSLKVIIDLYCFFSTNMYNEKQKTPGSHSLRRVFVSIKNYLRELFQLVFYSDLALPSAVFYIAWRLRNL